MISTSTSPSTIQLLLVILVLLQLIDVGSVSVYTTLYEYDLIGTSVNTNYVEGSKEYHCFDYDGTKKFYVRGTYGMYGYFEGPVSDGNTNVFYVNWYESTSGSIDTSASGSAILTYSFSWDEVQYSTSILNYICLFIFLCML